MKNFIALFSIVCFFGGVYCQDVSAGGDASYTSAFSYNEVQTTTSTFNVDAFILKEIPISAQPIQLSTFTSSCQVVVRLCFEAFIKLCKIIISVFPTLTVILNKLIIQLEGLLNVSVSVGLFQNLIGYIQSAADDIIAIASNSEKISAIGISLKTFAQVLSGLFSLNPIKALLIAIYGFFIFIFNVGCVVAKAPVIIVMLCFNLLSSIVVNLCSSAGGVLIGGVLSVPIQLLKTTISDVLSGLLSGSNPLDLNCLMSITGTFCKVLSPILNLAGSILEVGAFAILKCISSCLNNFLAIGKGSSLFEALFSFAQIPIKIVGQFLVFGCSQKSAGGLLGLF